MDPLENLITFFQGFLQIVKLMFNVGLTESKGQELDETIKAFEKTKEEYQQARKILVEQTRGSHS